VLLRFDFRRRLLAALFIGLWLMLMMGIEIFCIFNGTFAWSWFPLLTICILGYVFIFRHGDRIALAEPTK